MTPHLRLVPPPHYGSVVNAANNNSQRHHSVLTPAAKLFVMPLLVPLFAFAHIALLSITALSSVTTMTQGKADGQRGG
jgi:hypothetical protein